MELKHLKYFVEIAEQKSMRKAADRLYVTQPNLTRAMQNLEDEMGMKLLIRSNHGVSLTTTGESLYYYAQSVINQLSEIEALKLKDKEYVQNKLALSVGNIILKDEIMLNFYENLQTRHANISIYETSIEKVLIHVAKLEAEIGITAVNTEQYPALNKILEIKGLEAHEIASSPLYVHVGGKSPLYGMDCIEPRELLRHTYVHLPYDYFSNINELISLGDIRVMDFKHTIVINNYHAIVNMVKRTDAFIFGGKWQIDELKKGHIDSLLLNNCNVEKKLMWIKRKKEILSIQAREFLDIIKENYAD
ncbi:transcriptional regulator [Lachnospiraceae bacterium]|uniref:LysR family transcriptional regulator n=1 Tax=Extibacter sp. GGCC_0201 TaxID=2731209 RepID=UPI001AA11D63|nr:LysR family transcriptional regulator [Extibacter sp. GGCC_0201]MBO1720982.1 LysR family transcriptional regulator [Extibacter sp. GGCC_0201]BDF33496.1 transcriptional regulator [Lachnospiraceae bacterium]BDF37500.1 transcriptional regulator [Lachnospiraceae bacterium]